MVWHVDKYKIAFKLVKFQENLLRPGIIDARAQYRAVARRLRNIVIHNHEHNFSFLTCPVGFKFTC